MLAAAISSSAAAQELPKVAVLIDDLGYRWTEGVRAARLPGWVAVAILPHTTYSVALAREAQHRGKEIVLHIPMQAVEEGSKPGPGALELDQTRAEFAATFAADLAAVPFARGVNNHMGSLLTRHPGHMRWLMEELRARGPLFFIDSYTTHLSVGLQLAREHDVPALKRDVFLDSEQDAESIERQWERLLALARARGFALGIGHPRGTTLDVLERVLPQLQARGLQLVTLASLLDGYDGQNAESGETSRNEP